MKKTDISFQGKEFYETLFGESPVGIVIQGIDGRVERANARFCKMFGYSIEEVTGARLDDLVAFEPDLACSAAKLSTDVMRGRELALETERMRKDGSRFPVIIRGVPIVQGGKISAVYALYEDISETKEIENDLRRERAHFERIMLDSPDGIAVFDGEGTIIRCNPAFEDLFGLESGTGVGSSLSEAVGSGGKIDQVKKNIEELRIRKRMDHESVRTRKDGKDIFVAVRSAAISPDDNNEYMAVYRDISERKRSEEVLATERSYFENLFVNSPMAIALVDAKGIIQRVNSSFEDLFGYSDSECRGEYLDVLIAPEDSGDDAAQLTDQAAGGGSVRVERVRCRKDRTCIDVQIIAVSFPGFGGERVVYAIYQDITERKIFEEHARFTSYHDSLTGLFNQAFVEEEIQRLDTARQLPISVIMADLDNLKLVNDAFGHVEGDKLIIKTGNLLRSCCRQEDIVARCGGDEFLILLPGTPMQDAGKICDRIREGCSSKWGESFIPLSIALGLAAKTDVTEDFVQVIRKADEEMYLDKLMKSERSRQTIFERVETFLEGDHRRKSHIDRLANIASLFGEFMSLRKDEIDRLRLLARFHDVGLISVPADILFREGPLGPDEMEMIRKHPERGYHIARAIPQITHVAEGILSHQEKFDGSGYPRGLAGESIPLAGRIMHLLCAYEAMTGWRSYAPALSRREALEEIEEKTGSQFDPRLAGLFLKMMEEPSPRTPGLPF
ncbi:MAG TPA: PAS domain S-box protein [Synergistales bacterium]|nr:PAS domain S-box protein [Synergistales bacterium]